MTPTSPELVPVGDTTLLGTVVAFDDPRGIGTVRCGDRSVPFHCTAVTDGSRHIDVGTLVAVRIRAARLGRLEARSVHPLPAADGAGGEGTVADRPGAHSPGARGAYAPGGPPSVDEPSVDEPGRSSGDEPSADEPDDEVVSTPSPVPPVEPPSAPSASWPADESSTPVAGTPPVVAEPVAPAPRPGSGVGTGSGTGVDGADDGDRSAPRPNFWSPLSRAPAGPPPTWSTPVTPRVPPPDPS